MAKLIVDGVIIKNPDTGLPVRLQGDNVEPINMDSEGAEWLVSKGFKYLRVNVYWHKLEPQQGSYSSTYFGYLDNLLSLCQQYGIYVNLVFMQWEWSPYFVHYASGGGTGFPSWVIAPGGYPDSTIGLRDVIADFFMKRNSHGIWMRQKFFEFWNYVINRYKSNPYVVAYEIFNEPTIAKGVVHVSGVHDAIMNMYEEFTATFRPIIPDKIIVYHDIGGDGTAERPVADNNVAWTKSWYDLMWGGYFPSERSQVVSKFTALKNKYNIELGTPFIISEMGFTFTEEEKGGAELWITDSFDIMREVGLNNGYECYGWWIYNKGPKYNFVTPRNSDGSDTWIVPVLREYITTTPPIEPILPTLTPFAIGLILLMIGLYGIVKAK